MFYRRQHYHDGADAGLPFGLAGPTTAITWYGYTVLRPIIQHWLNASYLPSQAKRVVPDSQQQRKNCTTTHWPRRDVATTGHYWLHLPLTVLTAHSLPVNTTLPTNGLFSFPRCLLRLQPATVQHACLPVPFLHGFAAFCVTTVRYNTADWTTNPRFRPTPHSLRCRYPSYTGAVR